jgi:hypothetical protein
LPIVFSLQFVGTFELKLNDAQGAPMTIAREVRGGLEEATRLELEGRGRHLQYGQIAVPELAPKMQACEAPGRTLATTINARLANYRQLRPVSNI